MIIFMDIWIFIVFTAPFVEEITMENFVNFIFILKNPKIPEIFQKKTNKNFL